MTLREIRKSSKLFLTPAEVADLLQTSPESIRAQARTDPAKLPFPVMVVGTRTKIPRLSFIEFIVKTCGGCEG